MVVTIIGKRAKKNVTGFSIRGDARGDAQIVTSVQIKRRAVSLRGQLDVNRLKMFSQHMHRSKAAASIREPQDMYGCKNSGDDAVNSLTVKMLHAWKSCQYKSEGQISEWRIPGSL